MFTSVYLAEQRAAGKYIGKVEQIRGWYEDKSTVPMEDVAKIIRVTLSQFEQVLSLIKAHPDLDDREIADKTNWRKW